MLTKLSSLFMGRFVNQVLSIILAPADWTTTTTKKGCSGKKLDETFELGYIWEHWEYPSPSWFPWLETPLPSRCCWCCLGHPLPRLKDSSPTWPPQSTRSNRSYPLRKKPYSSTMDFPCTYKRLNQTSRYKKPSCSLANLDPGLDPNSTAWDCCQFCRVFPFLFLDTINSSRASRNER